MAISKIAKTINNSNTNRKSPKSVISASPLDEYFFWKAIPVTEQKLDKLAEKYLHWAENDEKALKITQFVIKERISLEDFYNWMDQNPKLKQAHKWVMAIIANRREIGAIERKYDASTIHKTMSHYDPVWKEQEIFKASLAKTEDEKSRNITVIVEKFPELESK